MGNLLPLFNYINDDSELENVAIFNPGPLKHILIDLGIRVLDNDEYFELTSELANIGRMHKRGSRNYKLNLSLLQRAQNLFGLLNASSFKPSLVHINRNMYSHLLTDSLISTRHPNIQCIRFKGFDIPSRDQWENIFSATETILGHMNIKRNFSKNSNNKSVIFINRARANDFYSSSKAHGIESGTGTGHTSGTQRRSIPNADELILAIGKFWEIQEVFLEQLTFKEQIEVFRDAKVIICQTGAGLANLVWAKPGTTLVEICPSSEDSAYWIEPMVEKLDINYFRVHQLGNHEKVPEKLIVDLLNNIDRYDN